MLSVVIPYYPVDEGKLECLNKAVESIKGQYDELIIVWNQGLGFIRAVNEGYKLAHGDFIAMCSDDIILEKGSLRDLCDKDAIVSAQIKDMPVQDFWGTLWVEPRWVYEKRGPIDEAYAQGIYYDDNEYYQVVTKIVPAYTNVNVIINHPYGGRTLESTTEREAKIRHNKEYFCKKWGHHPYILNENTKRRYGL